MTAKSRFALSALTASALLAAAGGVAAAPTPTAMSATPIVNTNITVAEVVQAQRAWGNALVQISRDFEAGGLQRARATAEAVLDAAYGYNMGPVLFKPTLTVAPQTFRTTREGALAYFVGGNSAFPADTGFALKGWRDVEVSNAAIFINGDQATTMGNVTLTDKNGQRTTVDKTWSFVKDDRGALRIVLHHSSLPFQVAAR